jgi:hypothetical protein
MKRTILILFPLLALLLMAQVGPQDSLRLPRLMVGNPTGGMPAAGVINAKGFKIDGVDVGTSSSSYWTADAPGIKYTAGPISLLGTPSGTSGDLRVGNLTATGNVTAAWINSNIALGDSAGPVLGSSLAAKSAPQGIVFSGTAVSVDATLSSAIGSNPVTFEVDCDIPATNPATTQALFHIGTARVEGTVRDFYALLATSGQLQVWRHGAAGGGDYRYLSTNESLVATCGGKRVKIAITQTGGTLAIYVNGVAKSTAGGTGGTPPAWSDPVDGTLLTIGRVGGSYSFAGFLGLRIYNYAKDAAGVLRLWETGAPDALDFGTLGSVPPSNTNLVGGTFTNFQYDTFSGASATGFTAVETGSQTSQAIQSSSGSFLGIAPAGARYLVTFSATLTSGATPGVSLGKAAVGNASAQATVVAGANSHILILTADLTAESSTNSGQVVFSTAGNTSYAISGLTVKRLGLLFAPDAKQAGAGTSLRDVSGNASHGTLPSSGVSWALPSSGYVGGNMTVGGTGTHSFGGPVAVSTSGATQFQTARSATSPANAGMIFGVDNTGPYVDTVQIHRWRGFVNGVEMFYSTSSTFGVANNLSVIGTASVGGASRNVQFYSDGTAANSATVGLDAPTYGGGPNYAGYAVNGARGVFGTSAHGGTLLTTGVGSDILFGTLSANPFATSVAGVTFVNRGTLSSTGLTLAGNLTVSGTGSSTFAGNLTVSGTGAHSVMGSFGVGVSPGTRLHVSDNTMTQARVDSYSTASYLRPTLDLRRGRGTSGAPANVESGDWLGSIDFSGYNGNFSYIGASIYAVVASAPGATYTPTDLIFVLATDSAVAAEKARITSNGDLAVARNVTAPGTIQVGGGSTLQKFLTNTATLDFPSTVAGAVSALTITVTGAAVEDTVALGVAPGCVTTTGVYFAWVSAPNTVTVRFSPKATEDPSTGVFRATVIKF